MTINQIIQELNQDILNFAIHLCRDEHKGHDLKQDAFVKAMEHHYRFADMNEHQVKAWFFKTIKNQYIDAFRREEKGKTLIVSADDELDFQDNKVLMMMLSNLKQDEQIILKMKYFGGYTSKEIAEQLNLNASTVRNRISSGLAKLRVTYMEGK